MSEEDNRSLSWKADNPISSSGKEPFERKDMRQAGCWQTSLARASAAASSLRTSGYYQARCALRANRRAGADVVESPHANYYCILLLYEYGAFPGKSRHVLCMNELHIARELQVKLKTSWGNASIYVLSKHFS